MLTPAQISFFHTFGYLHVPGYFASDIAWITAEYEAIWAAHPELPHDGSVRTTYPGLFVGASRRLATLIEHPRMIAVCTALLGAGYGLQGGDGNRYAGDTDYHSDIGFDGWQNKSVARHLKIAFYLDQLGRDSGALRVMPGTHRHGDAYAAAVERELTTPWEERPLRVSGRDLPAVAIENTPGDLVCFDHRIKHAAFGGSQRRRMFTTNWIQGATTPAMRAAVLDNYRAYRDHENVDWRITADWMVHAPAARQPMLAQMREFGALVMAEKDVAAAATPGPQLADAR